jgi:hypothetical protein
MIHCFQAGPKTSSGSSGGGRRRIRKMPISGALMDTIEPYRRQLFADALFTFDQSGRPAFDQVMVGRAKKNNKTTDLILACLYRFLAWPSDAGNDSFILAADEGQAGDDLALAKKLIAVNSILAAEVRVGAKEIERRDGRGKLQILPARDIAGSHGKTYLFVGFDEIHSYRSHDIFEALAPDPTRHDVLTWITSYDSIRNVSGIPLHDFKILSRLRQLDQRIAGVIRSSR